MSVSQKSLVALFTVALGGAAMIVACSSDDKPSNGTSSGTSGTASSSGSSGASSSSGSSGASDTDSGKTDEKDAGQEAGGGKANGEACTTASDTSTECASGVCAPFGSGGGTGNGSGGNKQTLCTAKCDAPNSDDDPKCAGGPPFTGHCNGQGYCKVSN